MERITSFDVEKAVYLIMAALFFVGYYYLKKSLSKTKAHRLFKVNRFRLTFFDMKRKIKAEETKNQNHFIDIQKYQTFRLWTLCGIMLFFTSIQGVLGALLIYILLDPSENAGRFTLYGLIRWFFERKNNQEKEFELYMIATQLLSMITAYEERPVSGKYLLKQIEPITKELKPTINKMIELFGKDKREEAADVLFQTVRTTRARMLSDVIRELDRQNPAKLEQQIRALVDDFIMKGETRNNNQFDIEGTLNYISPLLSGFYTIMNVINIYLAHAMVMRS